MGKPFLILFVMLLMIVGCSKSSTVITPDTVNIEDYESFPSLISDLDNFHYRLCGLVREDVFRSYPDLEHQYTTDLSKENFLKSKEAKQLREEMKKDLNIISQRTYRMCFHQIEAYNIEEKAFTISVPFGDIKKGKFKMKGFLFDVPWTNARHPFLNINIPQILIPVGKKDASNLEPILLGKQPCLIFNIIPSLVNDLYFETKDIGLVVVDPSNNKTLYAVKFSDFDEKKVWKKVDSAKVASLSPLQQAPAVENIKAERKESIEQLPQSVRKEVSQQPPLEQISEPSSVLNEELLGVKYSMTVESGIVYCNVNNSWGSISDNEKRNFLKQIGQKKYFSKTQFIAKDSKGVNLAEYKDGSIKFFRVDSKGKAQVNSLERYPVQQGKLSARDEQDRQRRIEIARNRVKYQEGRVETFKRDLEIAQRNPREARDSESSLRNILGKEEIKLGEVKQAYIDLIEKAKNAGVKVQ